MSAEASPEAEINRLRWRCRRGMRELDVVLEHYLEHDWPVADAEERAAFERLLELPDPELYFLLIGRNATDDPRLAALLERLRRTPRD
ncbi:MAG: hypothetical protein KatS3mg121_1533 [Gammaproteobacteria bacterium]|nr:MAG: hypothetical protein KatS3mg121_1533 [Gammaproteobacteria bacterium]